MALVAVVLAGCGGSSEPSASPREVVTSYYDGLADGDADKACGLLAPTARADIATYATATGARDLSECKSALEAIGKALPDDARAVLRRARVTASDVSGDRATVTVRGADHPVPLIRRDGDWRIAHLDFAYQTFRVLAGQVCTRFQRKVVGLPRPSLTRAGVRTYLEQLRSALQHLRSDITGLGNPPERVAARDAFLAGFAKQQRIATEEIARLKSGAPVRGTVVRYERRQRTTKRALNAAQAKLEVRCGE